MHTNTHGLDVARGVEIIRNNLRDLGFTERDADGTDFQHGTDNHLRFKTGTSYGEVTTLVILDNQQVESIRSTSWAGIDRAVLAIRQWIDREERASKR